MSSGLNGKRINRVFQTLVPGGTLVNSKNRKRDRESFEIEFRKLSSGGDPNSARVRNRLSELRDLIKAIDDASVEGAMIRSKEQWIELGEKPTKYFYQLECSRQSISQHDANDRPINSHTGVMRECYNFYKSLYSEEPIDETSENWLLEQLDSTLTFEEQAKCEGDLTVSECHEALSQMQSGKSPGSNTFLAEFYSCCWGLLGQDLVEILNFSFRKGTLSDSQRRGVLHLLYKKDDPLLLKNWRPISLLNIDYKIATKSLLNRLHKVLPLILSKDQTCGVPDCCIFENLFLMRDTIDYVRAKNLSAAIVSLDQEKAFDRVNHRFLQQVLKRFNFGPDFRRWVVTICNNISSQVLNNGWLSRSFPLEWGVRQGCLPCG